VHSVVEEIGIAAGLFAGLFIAFEIGFRIGCGAARSEASGGAIGQIGAIQGAILGLLGLLLAFSFGGAASRFIERQDLIVQEANAIGTSFLRADLLDEPHRSELRTTLQAYTEHRIEASRDLRRGISASAAAEIEQFHADIWRAASSAVQAKPAVMLGVLPPVNDVIDLHSTRVATGHKHLPLLVVGLLIACSLLAMAVIGYGGGIGGQRRAPLTLSLTLLIGLSLWIIIDLDHPRAGLMRVSDEPLRAIRFDATP
jgi:hypothetical protein